MSILKDKLKRVKPNSNKEVNSFERSNNNWKEPKKTWWISLSKKLY